MVQARTEYDWEHTSHLLWIHAEMNRDKKKRSKPFEPSDFSPIKKPRRRHPLQKGSIGALKAFAKKVTVIDASKRKGN